MCLIKIILDPYDGSQNDNIIFFSCRPIKYLVEHLLHWYIIRQILIELSSILCIDTYVHPADNGAGAAST